MSSVIKVYYLKGTTKRAKKNEAANEMTHQRVRREYECRRCHTWWICTGSCKGADHKICPLCRTREEW